MIAFRGKEVAMIFQNPMTCLNPVYTIGNQLVEALKAHDKNVSKEDAEKQAMKMLEEVGINNVEKRMKQYPHELSGGMRQRAALIRTMALKPDILLLDEPFSALDYQTRLEVCDDISSIIRTRGKTAILVTHDLSEAISVADRILILGSRPGHVTGIMKIQFNQPYDRPLARRNAPDFSVYFNQLWKEIKEHD